MVKGVNPQNEFEFFRQDCLRVENGGNIHPHHAEHTPQKLRIPKKHHGGGQQHSQPQAENNQAGQEKKRQNSGFMEFHPGDDTYDQQRYQRNHQVYHRGHDPGQWIDVFGHIDLGNQAGIAQDGAQRHAAGLAEKVEHNRTDNQIGCKVRHVTFEDGRKHKILHQHGKQRV